MCEDLVRRLQLGGYTAQAVADALTAMSANIAAKDKQIEELKAFSAIQETIIRNNSNPLLYKDRIFSLVLRVIEMERQLAKVTAERDAAVKAIPHKCRSCANGFYTDTGFDCVQTSYKSGAADRQSWQWRGTKKEN